MTTASRIRPHAPKIDGELVEAFKRIQTSIISDNLARLVSAGPHIRPFHGSAAMAGTALTVDALKVEEIENRGGKLFE